MKLLVHMNQLLYPADTGGKIRSSKLFERLSRKHDITIACFRRPAETDEQVSLMSACCSRLITVEKAETPPMSQRYCWELAKNLFSRYPFIVSKYQDRRMENKIARLFEEETFDALICDFLQPSLNCIRNAFRPKILFEHNVESEIRKRHYQQLTNPAAKAYMYLQWRKLFAFEKNAAAAYDHCIMVSERDCRMMAELYGAENTSAIPTGVDVGYFHPPVEGVPEEDAVVFTGSMDWLPNEDAVSYFVEKVLPLVRREINMSLWIVGRKPTPAVQSLAQENEGVIVTGTVDDIRPYVHRAKVYIVPLRVGGGTRIKIFEAMAMGKAVVSTTLGAEGLPVTHGENIIIADDPQHFARSIIDLARNEEARRRITQNARELVVKNYTWDVAADEFARICEEVAAEKTAETRLHQ